MAEPGTDWEQYGQRYSHTEYAQTDVPPLLERVLASGSGTLLDVGCGDGVLLSKLAARHADRWQLRGFEVSEVRARSARDRGLKVLVSPDGTVPVADASTDVVVSCHVVEHVPDDAAFVRELARLARPGGLVYLETPVKLPGGWYFRHNPQGGWVLDPTHLREYRSAAQVDRLVTDAGLQVQAEELTPIAYSLGAAEAVLRRVLRLPVPPAGAGGLRAVRVPVPRYRQQAVLARRPEPPTA